MIFRYSMLDAYTQCPLKFKHDYLEEKVTQKESLALKFGSALHLAFKEHYDGGSALDTFGMYWNSIKIEGKERYSWDDLNKLANEDFIPNFIKLHAKKITPIEKELEISIPFLDSHTLQGTIDLVCEVDGKLSILDYKTSSQPYKASKIIRNPQMYIYAYLYYKKTGKLPEQLIYKVFVKYGGRIQTIIEPLTFDKLNAIMGNVELICKDILSRIDTGNWYCNFNNKFCLTERGCNG